MSDTPADIASLIDEAAESASAHLFRRVQRRCLALLSTSDADGLLLFSGANVAGEAAERIEACSPMTDESNQGWRTLAQALSAALASGTPADLEVCIRLLHPPHHHH